jgi:hypothetical protein
MTPIERLENQFLIESLKMQLQESKNRALRAEAKAAALEQQMRREGWTEANLDEVQQTAKEALEALE